MLASRKAGQQVQVLVCVHVVANKGAGWYWCAFTTFAVWQGCLTGHLHFAFGIWHGTESHGYVSITKQLETTTLWQSPRRFDADL